MTFEVTGIDESIKTTKQIREQLPGWILMGILKVAEQLRNRGVVNAPIKTGDLRGAIRILEARPGDPAEVEVGTEGIPYALLMHEATYNLGPLSLAQPATPEGGVGNKFLQRPMDLHGTSDWMLLVKEEIERGLEKLG